MILEKQKGQDLCQYINKVAQQAFSEHCTQQAAKNCSVQVGKRESVRSAEGPSCQAAADKFLEAIRSSI